VWSNIKPNWILIHSFKWVCKGRNLHGLAQGLLFILEKKENCIVLKDSPWTYIIKSRTWFQIINFYLIDLKLENANANLNLNNNLHLNFYQAIKPNTWLQYTSLKNQLDMSGSEQLRSKNTHFYYKTFK